MKNYNIVFMGTPSIADNVLKKLIKNERINIKAVICQEDKPSGRKKRLTAPPTKVTAIENDIEVIQFKKITKELKNKLEKLDVDFLIVLAYGKILPKYILDIPKEMPINIHTSLLPKYRGASPIQEALLNRDKKTGVTIMKMDKGMDTGDIILKESVEILEEDNYSTLEKKLTDLSNKLIKDFFNIYPNINLVKQNDKNSSYCYLIEKNHGILDFTLSVDEIIGKIRAYSLWPKSYFTKNEKRFIIVDAKGVKTKHDKEVTSIELEKSKMIIYLKDGYIDIKLIQPQAKKVMDIKSFYNGYKNLF